MLAEELAREATEGSRDAAFARCKTNLREFAAALLACFRLPEKRNEEIRSFFPDLFA